VSRIAFTLRAYRDADFEACVALWQRSWQKAYPRIAFAKRLDWWRARWRDDLVPNAHIVIAEADGAMAGFVTVDRVSGYLDQLAVAPEYWGKGAGRLLLDAAKSRAPSGISLHVNCDNERGIGLYKTNGFVVDGEDVNPHSGAPVFRMRWVPGTP